MLANHFLNSRELSIETEQALLAHSWPGNVRELENACKRAAVLNPVGVITLKDFALQTPTISNTTVKVEVTKHEIEQAMHLHQGVIAKVARQFGMSRQALYRRLQKFEIDY